LEWKVTSHGSLAAMITNDSDLDEKVGLGVGPGVTVGTQSRGAAGTHCDGAHTPRSGEAHFPAAPGRAGAVRAGQRHGDPLRRAGHFRVILQVCLTLSRCPTSGQRRVRDCLSDRLMLMSYNQDSPIRRICCRRRPPIGATCVPAGGPAAASEPQLFGSRYAPGSEH
jgi:hypothetical protein